MELVILILLWIGVVLSTPYLLVAHFHSTITIHILHFLHRIGFDRSEDRRYIWEQFPEFETITLTTEDGKSHYLEWQDWFVLAFNETWLQRMIVDLITCPVCITFHLIFWQSLIILGICCFVFSLSPWLLVLAPIYALTAALPSLILYTYARKRI